MLITVIDLKYITHNTLNGEQEFCVSSDSSNIFENEELNENMLKTVRCSGSRDPHNRVDKYPFLHKSNSFGCSMIVRGNCWGVLSDIRIKRN